MSKRDTQDLARRHGRTKADEYDERDVLGEVDDETPPPARRRTPSREHVKGSAGGVRQRPVPPRAARRGPIARRGEI